MVREGEASAATNRESFDTQLVALHQQLEEQEKKSMADMDVLKKQLEDSQREVAAAASSVAIASAVAPAASVEAPLNITLKEYECLGGITQMYDRVVSTEKECQGERSKRKELGTI